MPRWLKHACEKTMLPPPYPDKAHEASLGRDAGLLVAAAVPDFENELVPSVPRAETGPALPIAVEYPNLRMEMTRILSLLVESSH